MMLRNNDPSAADQCNRASLEAIWSLSAAEGGTINAIRYWHRQRCFAMEQRKRADLALGAFLRIQLGWSRNLPEKERNRIAKQAAALMDNPAGEWADVINAAKASRQPFAEIERAALKNMEKLAKQLPVWPFCESIRGFGAASLAVIVGEAGDLSNYATVSKLWKRTGLAVIDGVRQGGLGKGAGAEAWIRHGYNPLRRSRIWNIGDAIIKGNRDGVYRQIYLKRKAYELERDPAMKPIKAHRRAQRYLEKRLLRDLWQSWRKAVGVVSDKTRVALPSSDNHRTSTQVEGREATPALPAKAITAVPLDANTRAMIAKLVAEAMAK